MYHPYIPSQAHPEIFLNVLNNSPGHFNPARHHISESTYKTNTSVGLINTNSVLVQVFDSNDGGSPMSLIVSLGNGPGRGGGDFLHSDGLRIYLIYSLNMHQKSKFTI